MKFPEKGKTFLIEKKTVTVSLVDYPILSNIPWHVAGDYFEWRIDGKILALHRLVLGLMRCPNCLRKHAEHRNGNKLDNRRSNLRPANFSENFCNRPKLRNSRNKYKGVVPNKIGHCKRHTASWSAWIKKDYVGYYLGTYTSEIEAAKAYDVASKKLHGNFACTNGLDTSDFKPVGKKAIENFKRIGIIYNELDCKGTRYDKKKKTR